MSHQHKSDNSCCHSETTAEPSNVVTPAHVKDIFFAATAGDVPLLKTFIEVEKVDVNKRQPDNCTALHWACLKNKIAAVKYLIEKGADVNATNNTEGHTPLMWACTEGNLFIIHYLLEHGADLHKCDLRGYNALHHAVQYDELLAAHFLISKGLFIDCKDNDGHTPLMWAAYMDFDNGVRYLISQGADIHAKDNSGFTALHWSALKGKSKALRALLREDNIDVLATDNNGETPSQMAQRKGFPRIANELRKFARSNTKGISEKTLKMMWFSIAAVAAPTVVITLAYFPYLIIAILLLFGTQQLLKRSIGHLWLDANHRNPLLVGVVLSFFTLSAFIYFIKVLPVTSGTNPTETILFITLNMFFFPLYIKLLYSDPGYIPIDNTDTEWKIFMNELENERPLPQFCLTCMVRRPLRGKHCRSCNRCIARFDHHCGWLNSCVGVNNHGPFLLFVLLVCLNHMTFAHLCSVAIGNILEVPSLLPLNYSLPYIFNSEPLIFVAMCFHILFSGWQGFLMLSLMNGIRYNKTTNEMMNGARYSYLKGNNPFNKGLLHNLKDTLYPQVNWYTTYHLNKSV